MADQSQYLVQALQQLQAGGQAPVQAPTMSPQQMQQIMQQRQAFEAANPGQSYMAHGIQQMGHNAMQAPQNAMSGLARLAQGYRPAGG